ncbi:hypothetical protein LCGC14_3143170, partial [marine sediment metagenome]
HVACYGTMVCVSWMLGRKYFRIQYPYKSIGIYVLIALGVYVGAAYTANMESVTRLLINTGLLVVFSIIVVLKEYRNIKNLSG